VRAVALVALRRTRRRWAALVLLGVLGGTLAHGIVGLFVGPIILAVGWELLMAWSRDEPASSSGPGSGELQP